MADDSQNNYWSTILDTIASLGPRCCNRYFLRNHFGGTSPAY
jgi:hypothetical protein